MMPFLARNKGDILANVIKNCKDEKVLNLINFLKRIKKIETDDKNILKLDEWISLDMYLNWCKTKEDLDIIKNSAIYKKIIKNKKRLKSILEKIDNAYYKIMFLETRYSNFLIDNKIWINWLENILKNEIGVLEKKLKLILEYKDKLIEIK